jgi:hypothetical protein
VLPTGTQDVSGVAGKALTELLRTTVQFAGLLQAAMW